MTPGSWHLSPPPPDCEPDFTWETVQLTYAIKITCAARMRITKRRQAFAILAYVCKEKEHFRNMLDSQEKEQNEHRSTRSKDVGILKKGLEKWPPRMI